MHTETPRISILIPTLDEAGWVVHSVRSARASLRAAQITGEIIVCDGGSRDTTASLARRHADRVIDCPPGRAAQLNAGAKAAGGDILVMLHADTLLGPGAICSIADAIGSGAGGGWFQIAILAEEQTLLSTCVLDWMAWGINLRTRLFQTATADQCIFCRRDIFDELGGLPDVELMEGNLFARALRGHSRVAILGPELRISGRRWEKNGLFRTMLLMYGIRAAHRAGVPERVLAQVWQKLSR